MIQKSKRLSTPGDAPRFTFPLDAMQSAFDRVPQAFTHNLHTHDAFDIESLTELAGRYADHPQEYFVASGAPSAGSDFCSVSHGRCGPTEAISNLDSNATRILLKRPENHDERFRKILDDLFAQVLAMRGGLRNEKLIRLESAVFITSPNTVTPFHFDPEIAFFAQLEGTKHYHIYAPKALGEAELEEFYSRGVVSIGPAGLDECATQVEQVFHLSPGKGMHQPRNAPHWVETQAKRSISYSFVFETDATRASGRVLAFNHFARKAGLAPTRLGANPTRDALKAGIMRGVLPLQRRAYSLIRRR